MFSNASPALFSVAFYFVLKAWSSNIYLICGLTKIPSCIWPHLFWEIFASIAKPFAFFIHRQPKVLKMSYSKSLVPKLYLYLRPYRQNTVHGLFLSVLTVGSYSILTPLHHKCSRNYLPYFGKNMTSCTQEKYLSDTWGTVTFALVQHSRWRVDQT
jgi:hypothetical protein